MDSTDPTRETLGEVVLREERLFAEKAREIDRLAAVVRDVATTDVSRHVAILFETLHLQRRATDVRMDYDVAPIGDPQRLVVRVSRESITVGKRVVVSEEVDLRRRRVQDVRHVSGIVRRERLTVEERVDE